MVTALQWDKVGERRYETGVDHGVLYQVDENGEYVGGVVWNGLTTVTEAPTGAEQNPQYADNIKYLNLQSVEEFGGTIEAFTYPDEFGVNDGTAEPVEGMYLGQQTRLPFGLCYRTKIGDDLNPDRGYKLHLVYGALASPSEKAYSTVNDSPEATALSWEFTTTAVAVEGHKPSATLVIDSTKTNEAVLEQLEELLYGVAPVNGTGGVAPRLPLPDEIFALVP